MLVPALSEGSTPGPASVSVISIILAEYEVNVAPVLLFDTNDRDVYISEYKFTNRRYYASPSISIRPNHHHGSL